MHSVPIEDSASEGLDAVTLFEDDFAASVQQLVTEIAELYLSDAIPWVVGYSGGKDSTATLQLVWMALERLGPEQRTKPVHVISTDTLVENPIVAAWVGRSLDRMNEAAESAGLPISSHRLTPAVRDTFWVNLIGRGYPAPRPKFRWCTERLKILPSHRFIKSMVDQHGETILVLGTRKAESAARAAVMERYEAGRIRGRLSPNGSLPNSFIYSPIENWSNDEVWLFLVEHENPWGHTNRDLLSMYRGASADGECPLVVDTGTPSCGDSRFGCWVCTLVEKDRSMQAMIRNDAEKEWMQPLLALRNELDYRLRGEDGDRSLRDFRRSTGHVQLFHDRPIPGPYRQDVRHRWLKRVLEVERHIRERGPEDVRDIELITMRELKEIRRIWVADKHEIEDMLPGIYEAASCRKWPREEADGGDRLLGDREVATLQEVCGEDRLHFELTRELLSVEQRFSANGKRRGIFKEIEKAFLRNAYRSEEEAVDIARWRQEAMERSQDVSARHPFDGEQIEAYADPEKTSELIESAILNLLGLNIDRSPALGALRAPR